MENGKAQYNHSTEEIVLCSQCEGFGKIDNPKIVRNAEDPDRVDCPKCGGTGRLRKIETVEYEMMGAKQNV